MIAAYGKFTQAGIDRRNAAARAEAHWAEKRAHEERERIKAEMEERAEREERERIDPEVLAWVTALEGGSRPVVANPIRYDHIEAVACREFGVTRMELKSERREQKLTMPRHFIYYWTSKLTALSMSQVGRLIHRDHTTVLHGRDSYLEKTTQPRFARFRHVFDNAEELIRAEAAKPQMVAYQPIKQRERKAA